MTEYLPVEPDDLCPDAIFERWPDTVPVHGITILDALRPEGNRALHVVHDTAAPIWVLIGMVRSVLADLESRWVIEDYQDADDDHDD